MKPKKLSAVVTWGYIADKVHMSPKGINETIANLILDLLISQNSDM